MEYVVLILCILVWDWYDKRDTQKAKDIERARIQRLAHNAYVRFRCKHKQISVQCRSGKCLSCEWPYCSHLCTDLTSHDYR